MKRSLLLFSLLGHLAVCRADAVRLQINGPDGKPVAGATVQLTETKVHIAERTSLPVVTAQSDAAGEVVFNSKNSLAPGKYSWNSVGVWAQITAPGRAVNKVEVGAGENHVSLGAGHTLSGRVLDDKEQPAAGVVLVLRSLLPLGGRLDELPRTLKFDVEDAPRTLSKADGTWDFEGMPATGSAEIAVVDPRFCPETFHFDVSQSAPPIELARGAALTGRLLKPDGSGAGGVEIEANGSPQTTAVDGTFRFDGLGDGSARLGQRRSVSESPRQQLPFIVPAKRVGGLKRGEVRDSGDWKALAGVHIRGRVVSGVTKKGVEGAWFGLYGSEFHTDSHSGKDGSFDFVALDDIEELAINTDDFRGLTRKPLPTPKVGVIDVGTLELEPQKPRVARQTGKTVEGTIRTQAGIPVGVRFSYTKDGEGARSLLGQFGYSKENGKFSLEGVEKGSYSIAIHGAHTVSGGQFIVGDKAPEAVQVVVEGKNPTVVSAVQGRVVDETGAPVAGARVFLSLFDIQERSEEQTVLCDADGRYSAPFALVEGVPSVMGVTHPGFAASATRGSLKNGNGVWRGDFTVQHSGLAVRGRVVDTAGQPVVGAFVASAGGSDLPVETDARGEFSLVDEPIQNVKLVASDGPRLVSQKFARADGGVQLVLPGAAPINKIALADEMLQRARVGSIEKSDWDALGPKRMTDVFLQSGGPFRGGDNHRRWTNFLRTLCDRAPQILVAREAEIRERAPRDNQAEVSRLAMVARASSNDPAGRAKVKAWLGAQHSARELMPQSVRDLLGIAEVAERLEAGAGKSWLDAAFQIASQLDPLQNDGKNSDDTMHEWATLAARTDPNAPLELVRSWPPAPAASLMQESLGVFAARGDAPSARRAFAALQRLTNRARNTPELEGKPKALWSPGQLLSWGRNELALALLSSDPGAAFEQAKLLDSYQRPQVVLLVARAAIRQKEPELARRAMRALFGERLSNTHDEAEAATLAEQFDPVLAGELWAKTLASIREGNGSFEDYARLRAAKFPGQSRILLEREWLRDTSYLSQHARKDDTGMGYSAWSLQSVVGAMALVAPERAVAMLNQLPEKEDLRARTQTSIAESLLHGE